MKSEAGKDARRGDSCGRTGKCKLRAKRANLQILHPTSNILHGLSPVIPRVLVPLLLGGVVLLLLAGADPWRGAPAVYRSGVMLVLGGLAGLLSLLGVWKAARHRLLRFGVGLCLLALTVAAVPGLVLFGEKGIEYAHCGGAMWFGAVGMACLALVSLMIAGVLGYLGLRAMRAPGLWGAGMHLAVVIILTGAFTDYFSAREVTADCGVGGAAFPAGEQPFSVRVDDFSVTRYEGGETYTLLRHSGGSWQYVGTPRREGDTLRWGEESWPVAQLLPAPDAAAHTAQRYLLLPGRPPRLLLQHAAPIREYRAHCRLVGRETGKTAKNEKTEQLRVNHPISFCGWQVYLMSADPAGTRVHLLLRRAPGRPFIYAGAIGLVLCSLGWGFAGTRRKEAAA